ncbi:MAG: NAD(+)/NADH kinase [Myxococcota bacterium]
MIVHDPRNPRAVALYDDVTARLPDLDARTDITVVIGGDGFLLHTVHRFGFNRSYLGLNGGTLGFLLNDVSGRLDEVCDAIAKDAWIEHRFPLLRARVVRVDGTEHVDHAMNDVYLERSSGQTARVDVSISGYGLQRLAADGMIFATALGSTAYNFSAGGVPCDPGLPVMCVTPICPHKPRLSPFVVPYGTEASIEVYAPDRRPVRAVIDGRDVDDVARVTIGPTTHVVRIAYLEGHDFTRQMMEKLLN